MRGNHFQTNHIDATVLLPALTIKYPGQEMGEVCASILIRELA
jgi:hypothetical protein